MIEDRLLPLLAAYIDENRPEDFPDAAALPVHVAARDELRARPCVVLDAPESKPVMPMPETSRIRLEVHLFTQADDTPAATHDAWATAIADVLAGRDDLLAAVSSGSFLLHDLIPRESTTPPDEARGRESILVYEAVATGPAAG